MNMEPNNIDNVFEVEEVLCVNLPAEMVHVPLNSNLCLLRFKVSQFLFVTHQSFTICIFRSAAATLPHSQNEPKLWLLSPHRCNLFSQKRFHQKLRSAKNALAWKQSFYATGIIVEGIFFNLSFNFFVDMSLTYPHFGQRTAHWIIRPFYILYYMREYVLIQNKGPGRLTYISEINIQLQYLYCYINFEINTNLNLYCNKYLEINIREWWGVLPNRCKTSILDWQSTHCPLVSDICNCVLGYFRIFVFLFFLVFLVHVFSFVFVVLSLSSLPHSALIS